MLNQKLIHSAKVTAAALLVVSAIGFVEKKHHDKTSNALEISILNQNGNYFVSEEDIMALIADPEQPLLGYTVPEQALNEMEHRLTSHQFIDDAQVSKDLKGDLVIQVYQSTPIARLLRRHKPDAYITGQGNMLPTSEKFSARVPLVSGDFTNRLIEEDQRLSENAAPVLELLKYIDQHHFWGAQIAQLDIDLKGNIIMYAQVGKQYIEFGQAQDIESKFQRLELFYKKILPKEGWNKYQRVNVQYRDQIICE